MQGRIPFLFPILALPVVVAAAVYMLGSGDDNGDYPAAGEGQVLDCPAGDDVRSSIRREGDQITVTGRLLARDGRQVSVEGPEGPVVLEPTINLDEFGPIAIGDPVIAGGVVFEGTGELVAQSLRPACIPGAAVAGDNDGPTEAPAGDTPAPPPTEAPEEFGVAGEGDEDDDEADADDDDDDDKDDKEDKDRGRGRGRGNGGSGGRD